MKAESQEESEIELQRGRKVNLESQEAPAKPAIHVFPEHHPSKESEDSKTSRPQIHMMADRHASKESEPEGATKIGVKMSNQMSATTETEARDYKPHMKSCSDMFSTKESTKTTEVSFPKLKHQDGSGVSKETEEKEWRVKPVSVYGHVSQLSRQELQINVPRLKRREEIYASLESADYKDYGIKPRIRMSKHMSATRESEAGGGAQKPGIKFSQTMSSTKESEWVDVDKLRLEKFKQQNIHGHSSDSTVQALLYGPKTRKGRLLFGYIRYVNLFTIVSVHIGALKSVSKCCVFVFKQWKMSSQTSPLLSGQLLSNTHPYHMRRTLISVVRLFNITKTDTSLTTQWADFDVDSL